ncbi:MAG TPA: hypothetical protein VF720_05660 [Candidatus Eisenbacteria bacterium]
MTDPALKKAIRAAAETEERQNPAPDARVPDIQRKPLEEIVQWNAG